ncbi:MAG: diaminopimelate decarboxylase [Pseudomonadota bacterium]
MASLVDDAFVSRDGTLHCERVSLATIADHYGTPCWVYSKRMVLDAWAAYDRAFADHPHLICYAVKANGNIALLQQLADAGAGFDIVSIGELARVLAAGADPSRVVYSGVCKTPDDLATALARGIRCFNVESAAELDTLAELAEQAGVQARVALRVNPNISVDTHPYIATGLSDHKFGIPIGEAPALYRRAGDLTSLQISGIACHIGSQIRQLDAFASAASALVALADELETKHDIIIDHLDLGGGLGLDGDDDQRSPGVDAYVKCLVETVNRGRRPREIVIEPGRSIVAEAGVLLTRVHYVKRNGERTFALTDAGMNEFLRPALYGAEVPIVPVEEKTAHSELTRCDVVGPVCESADFIGRDRSLPLAPKMLLAVGEAGAYGASMSSHYNARPLAAEVLIDGADVHLVRERESLEGLMRGEHLAPGTPGSVDAASGG